MLWGFMIVYTFLILFGDWLVLPNDELDWCHAAQQGYPNIITNYPNPDTNNNPCYRERTMYLLGLTQFETDFSRRMIISVILGSIIGYERKAADRPAGVRTMSLVCLGACFFTMCGQHAFGDSTQTWDAARVSAAIPSGVGFLGSALIWKHTTGSKQTNDERQEVHGLTTASSVWLSASIGIGAGGHLYVTSLYAVTLAVFVLRLGPRMYLTDDHSYGGLDTESEWDDTEDDEPVPLTREEQRELLQTEAMNRHEQLSSPSGMRENSIRRSSSYCQAPTFHG